MAAALDQAVQRPGDHPSGAGAAQDARDDAGDQPPRTPVLHRRQQPRQHARQRHRRGPRRLSIGKEAVQDPRQIEPRQHAGHLLAGKYVCCDEAAERCPEPLLLMRDDRRVRDGDAERMAEQGRHREPVGDAADEAGLGTCLQQIARPPFGQRVAAEGERGHQDQQRGGEGPVTRQCAPCSGLRIGFCHAALSIAAAVAERTPPSKVPRSRRIG